MTAEVVRQALAQVHQVYACLKPYEQRELMRLVVHRAEVHVRELVLEINGGMCPEIAPATVDLGDVVRRTQNWLPELVPQSVIVDVSVVRLASLREWFAGMREELGGPEEWGELLQSGRVATRAELARSLGVSRSRVTQALGAMTKTV